jgi:hypothetical protein
MAIVELVERVSRNPKCRVAARNVAQPLDPTLSLPEDLKEFYDFCGGADLFLDEDYGFRIVSPSELKPATPEIHRILYAQNRATYDNDISAWWYFLGKSHGPEEGIVIDLHPERLGRCYDGYVGTYASTDCRVIALSFTEALEWLLKAEGRELFWDREDFPDLGHAYDGYEIEPPCG